MTPSTAYRNLNRLIWLNRLPKATITLVGAETLPHCYGLTVHDDVCVRPVILLNTHYKKWGKTLVHEMLHVAEPSLRHGKVFSILVEFYWRIAKTNLKALETL